jgi:hypothetical protein
VSFLSTKAVPSTHYVAVVDGTNGNTYLQTIEAHFLQTSNIRGNLQVRDAQAQFSMLEFAVPGASASLKGSYGLKSEAIDLHGRLQLSSKLSQTTMGLTSVWLRALDPLFRGGSGGSVLPIKITGSRSNPAFGLELRRHEKPA